MIIFNEGQTEFFKKEFGLSFIPNQDSGLSRSEWGKLKDDVFEIEVDETMAAGNHNPLNKRGEIAVSIVDMRYSN